MQARYLESRNEAQKVNESKGSLIRIGYSVSAYWYSEVNVSSTWQNLRSFLKPWIFSDAKRVREHNRSFYGDHFFQLMMENFICVFDVTGSHGRIYLDGLSYGERKLPNWNWVFSPVHSKANRWEGKREKCFSYILTDSKDVNDFIKRLNEKMHMKTIL